MFTNRLIYNGGMNFLQNASTVAVAGFAMAEERKLSMLYLLMSINIVLLSSKVVLLTS